MPTLEDFMPKPMPEGWRLIRRYEALGVKVALYERRDGLNVSMSWEDRAPPYLQMSFSRLNTKPSREEALEATKQLLPTRSISSFTMFDQISGLHAFTVHAQARFVEEALS